MYNTVHTIRLLCWQQVYCNSDKDRERAMQAQCYHMCDNTVVITWPPVTTGKRRGPKGNKYRITVDPPSPQRLLLWHANKVENTAFSGLFFYSLAATYKRIFLRQAAFFYFSDLYSGAEYIRPKMHSSKDKPLIITTGLLFAGGRPPQASVWMWRQPVIDWHCHEGQTCEQAVAWFSRTTTAEQPASDDTFIFCHSSHDFSSRHLSFPRCWNLACPKELLPCSCHAASGELHIGDLPVTSAWFGFRYEHKEEELWEEGT